MKNFFLLCGIGLIVMISIGADVQSEKEDVMNGYKIISIKRDKDLKSPFKIDSIASNSSGQLVLTVSNIDSPEDLAAEMESKWTGEIQNKDTGESRNVSIQLKKRCTCSDGSGYIKCPSCTCPGDCTKVEWVVFISAAPGPKEEMIFGDDPDFLYLMEMERL